MLEVVVVFVVVVYKVTVQ